MYRQNPTSVFLIDDHTILLDGLASIISAQEGLEIIATATSAAEAIDKLQQVTPDLLITDYSLPDSDGLSLIRQIKKLHPDLNILVLSMHEEAHLVKDILREGVSGYVLKKDSKDELIQAVETILAGKTHLSSEINQLLIDSLDEPANESLLTPREREILRLIAREYTNKKIAESLVISERTVETHRKNIFRKTKTHSLVGLMNFARANHLI